MSQYPLSTVRPLRAAVVGTGVISEQHLSFLASQTTIAGDVSDRAELQAVCDLSASAAKYAAERFGAAAHFTDAKEMYSTVNPDVVHVLTPPHRHVTLVEQALAAGAHVICEKPITATANELQILQKTAHQAERHLIESHNYRFNDGVIALKELIDNAELGAIREVEIRVALPVTDPAGRFGDRNMPSPIHQMPAGVIHDFTTHFTYLLIYLSGTAMFDQISAAWNNHSGNDLFRYDNLDATLIGRNANGPVHGRLRFDANAKPDAFTIVVRGTRGYAETDLFQPFLRVNKPRTGGGQLSPIANHVQNGIQLMWSGIENVGKKIMQKSPYHGLHRMLDQTYTALATGAEPPVTASQMAEASAMVDQLVQAEAQV